MKIYKYVFIALLLAAATCQAQDLAHLQQSALSNRGIIQRYQLNLEMSREDITLGKSVFYPRGDLSYAINVLDDGNLMEDSENSVFYGGMSYNLFNGFGDKYGLLAAQLINKVEEHRLNGVKQDIKRNVALRYLAIFSSNAALQVSKDSLDTLQKVHDDGANRFKVGLIRKNELLKFQVDLDNATITLKKAEAGLRKSILLLEREIDTQVIPESLTFSEFDQVPHLESLEKLTEEMYKRRSELKAMEELSETAKAQIGMQSAARYPTVDLAGGYRRYDNDFINGNGDRDDEELRGTVSMSLNLFDGYATGARIGKAKLQARALLYDLEETKKDLTTQLANLYLDYQVSLENVVVAESSIKQAEENLRVTRLAYEEGLERQSDLLDAIANLSRAKYNYVAAKSEVYSNYFRINRSVEAL